MTACPSFTPIAPTPVATEPTEVDDEAFWAAYEIAQSEADERAASEAGRLSDLAFIERVIANTREFPPLGHASIAYLLGVTKSRVSQIETMAMAKLKRRGKREKGGESC